VIALNVRQGSPQWQAARLGLPTASAFANLITPRTRQPSKSADKYLHRLLAESQLGRPLDDASSLWMERGKAMEDEAVALYEFQHDVDTEIVGFVLRDDGRVGCSPDRFVGGTGILEIKVPSAEVHAGYLMGVSLEDVYRPQVQGMLWICERQWAHLLSYNPEMRPALERVERDEEFIESLAEIVDGFVVRLDEAREQLRV
jgi:hypothetical protein